ncbi:unnamed protein product [Linum tenue]|uniref:ADP-ribosyl cyclase/cyclic ADP-ribose hydrolase n=1 Tax=Linum tenue TaxID=586396 RepID=A0AAV0REQ8_9ROSI|nr:unnamed protein product [Linum tenue]
MASTSAVATSSSSSISLPSPYSPPPPRWTHDVFLSFRGRDTRNSFTGHLHAALVQKGIRAYKDDRDLDRGEAIEAELFKAIEGSRFSVVVFSRNYADSPWCLDELVKIVQCKEGPTDHTVLPVFYDVDPSEVAEMEGLYAAAFAEHEVLNPEKVESWRKSVAEVAQLAGWDAGNRNEAEVIKEIVERIWFTLNHSIPIMSNDLVGMDARVDEIVSNLLDEESVRVRFLGICGMGGLGKTTIAKVVYDKIRWQFEGCCFLANVRESFEKHGPLPLQQRLLSEILMRRGGELWDADKGISEIKHNLQRKKVLLVLDDVDHPEQLEMLAGDHEWFGPGSLVIITSRDEHLLAAHKVDETYEAKALNNDEALVLFSSHAFKQDSPVTGYSELSKRVVGYAKGLPLGLKVLGSFLNGRNIRAWNSAIKRLNEIPNRKIVDVLQISFDALEETEKKIFLDIACFFKAMDKDEVTNILDSCGFHAEIGIQVLIDKSLISVSKNRLVMHDLLQLMGRDIVRRESPEEPGKRSRIWTYEDASHVLTKNSGGEEVEVIFVDLPQPKDANWTMEAFSRMTKLRLLKICNVNLSKGPAFLSNELRYLDWDCYPAKSLPSSFHSDKLVRLILHHSKVEQLWFGIRTFRDLRIIELEGSSNFTRIPDFTEIPNLERLVLTDCTRLSEVHSSIGHLKKLAYISLLGCSKVRKFSEILVPMDCLVELILDETGIEKLPMSIHNLGSLAILSLRFCKDLRSIPSSITTLKSLKKLDLSGCLKLKRFPDVEASMKCLEELYLDQTAIEELPSSIQHLSGLVLLSLRFCNRFIGLPSSISCLNSLRKLDLCYCSKLERFPDILEVMEGLRELCLDWTNIKELPPLDKLIGLELLSIEGCVYLKDLSSICGLKSIRTLDITWFGHNFKVNQPKSKLSKIMPNATRQWMRKFRSAAISTAAPLQIMLLPSFSSLCALRNLTLSFCNLLDEVVPNDLGCLSSLRYLDLSGNEFSSLPASINQLLMLEELNLDYCWELQSLPVLPPNVSLVRASFCDSLTIIADPIKLCIWKASKIYCFNCFELVTGFNCSRLVLGSNKLAVAMIIRYIQGLTLPRPRFDIVYPGAGIPKWFIHYSEGSSVSLEVPPNLHLNTNWMGFAACAIFTVVPLPQTLDNQHFLLTCHFIVNGKLDSTWPSISFQSESGYADHIWSFYFSLGCLSEWPPEGFGSIELSFEMHSPEITVKQCGGRLIYRRDAGLFYKVKPRDLSVWESYQSLMQPSAAVDSPDSIAV